jgi:hypothetical protein
VVAAGIEAGADAIITWNLGDFPTTVIEGYGIEVRTPDQLICALLDASATDVLAAMRQHRKSLKNPPKSPAEYLETLALQGLRQSVERLRNELSRL